MGLVDVKFANGGGGGEHNLKPELKITDKYIEVIGHYDDEVLCAKMTMLADLYAIEHREGYAKFKIEDADKLKFVNAELNFVIFRKMFGNDNNGNILYFHTGQQGSNITNFGGNIMDGVLVELSLTNNSIIYNGKENLISLYQSKAEPYLNDIAQIQFPDGSIYNAGETFSFTIKSDITFIFIRKSKLSLDVTYDGTKIIDNLEVESPIEVSYNGNIIATLEEASIKTLQCNGKLMASDVTIGERTLQCNGKLMTSDVIIEVN